MGLTVSMVVESAVQGPDRVGAWNTRSPASPPEMPAISAGKYLNVRTAFAHAVRSEVICQTLFDTSPMGVRPVMPLFDSVRVTVVQDAVPESKSTKQSSPANIVLGALPPARFSETCWRGSHTSPMLSRSRSA